MLSNKEMESVHTKWSLTAGSGDNSAYGVPHRDWTMLLLIYNTIYNKVLDFS